MSLLLQLTINGLIAGSIYALVASGFSLIYGTNKFMHFAHGIAVVFAGYLVYTEVVLAKFPLFLTLLPAIAVTSLFGLFIYEIIYSPLQKRKASNVILLIASIAVLILFQNLIQAVYGPDVKTIELYSAKSISFAGATITSLQLYIILVSCILFIALYLLLEKTSLGRQMRAIFDNKELASVVGINYRSVVQNSFLIGSALAGIAGILVTLDQNITPVAGTNLIIKGFTAAVIGGVTSVPAALLGGYILGLAENYGIWYLPSTYKDAIAFALLFIFLLFKPNGLFGIDRRLR